MNKKGFKILREAPPVTDHWNPRGVFVKASVTFTREGDVVPLWIEWEDGTCYEVTRLMETSDNCMGRGVLYLCLVHGKEVHLYYDQKNRFFMERRGTSE